MMHEVICEVAVPASELRDRRPMRRASAAALGVIAGALCAAMLAGCAARSTTSGSVAAPAAAADSSATTVEIPEATRQWMDRLTVKTEYDPKTGFIVAREVVPLPTELREGPAIEAAVQRGRETKTPVLVFATADRCGPCQQYKKDAINDARVVEMMRSGGVIATHVEVDREKDAAVKVLGPRGLMIPMTYWVVDGAVAGTLRGQRSADDLVKWIEERRGGSAG
jgi:thiol:disulfide interchange protein